MSPMKGLQLLLLLAACATAACVDEPPTGTTAQESVASTKPRWPDGKLEFFIDVDGTLRPLLCYQFGDVVASGDPIVPGDDIAILRAIEHYNDLTPMRMTAAASEVARLVGVQRVEGTR